MAERPASAFARLGQDVRPREGRLFFLAGHRKTVDGRNGFPPRGFLSRSIDNSTGSSVDQAQLQVWISGIPAQTWILPFDTCECEHLTREAVPRGLER